MFDYSKQKPRHEYGAQFGDSRGSIAVFDDGLLLKQGRKDITVPFNYIDCVERLPGEPLLGKVEAIIHYYDMFGNKETARVRMQERDVEALRQDVDK